MSLIIPDSALLRQRDIATLERPTKMALKTYQLVMQGPHNGSPLVNIQRGALLGDDRDLVGLNRPILTDPLSKLIRRHWRLRDAVSDVHNQFQIDHSEERRLLWVINLCSNIVAAILLIAPILALYFVTEPDSRLGLVIAFIIFFAAALAVSTGASRDSIFAATAAYTAVLLVFVSGDLGNAKAKG
jgi:hypothetical protein